MAVKHPEAVFEQPVVQVLENTPGLSVLAAPLDALLTWGRTNSLWIFAMATSCCGIEFMTAPAPRTDIDQMGSVPFPSPRHCDVMIVAGTITVKMAPRVKRLWEQMPEPKWCIAMGSCAISGDFYRDVYSVVPGVDTIVPVDVYIPGCPPNSDDVMRGLKALQAKVRAQRRGSFSPTEHGPEVTEATRLGNIPRFMDTERPEQLSKAQHHAAMEIGLGGNLDRAHDAREEGA
jgi:NADH-quinone oxidoreductase subunit B